MYALSLYCRIQGAVQIGGFVMVFVALNEIMSIRISYNVCIDMERTPLFEDFMALIA